MNQKEYELFQQIILRESGMVITPSMQAVVQSRMRSLLRQANLPSFEAMLDRLQRRDRALMSTVIDVVTTNETSFFRDPAAFEILCGQLLPAMAERTREPLTVWSAACSTGQEPYTMLMAAHEYCPDLVGRINVIATDISEAVVSKAREGRFSGFELSRGLTAEQIESYFIPSGEQWQVRDDIRRRIQFSTGSLTDCRIYPSRCDVVFIRNVLIYLDAAAKADIFRWVHDILPEDGCLFFGASEMHALPAERWEVQIASGQRFHRCRKVSGLKWAS